MILEGEVSLDRIDFITDFLDSRFEKHLAFGSGYIGLKGFRQFGNYLMGLSSKIEGVKILSNTNTRNFTPFSFDQFVKNCDISSLVIAAWYDSETQELTLFREAFARTPLYYMIGDHNVAFSTSLHSLLSNSQYTHRYALDDARIASYTSVLGDASRFYSDQTFYSNIKTVLPGHSIMINVRSKACKYVSHICYRPSKWNHLATVQEFGEEIRAKFRDTVTNHLSSIERLAASHLSGGLDSSSISAMANLVRPELELHTIYNKSNTLNSEENRYALSVANRIGSAHHEIVQPENDFETLCRYIPLFGEPAAALISPSSTGFMMQVAKSLGCELILDGRDGDSVVGSGLELINLMFEKKQWEAVKNLLRERVAYYSFAHEYPGWDTYSFEKKYQIVLQSFLYKRLASKLVQLPLGQFTKLMLQVSANFPVSYPYLAKKLLNGLKNRAANTRFSPIPTVLTDEVARQRIKSSQELLSMLDSDSPEHRQSLRDVYNAQSFFANEQTFALSNHYDIVSGSPFYNQELFELCLAVPDRIKYGDGIGRAHFREAMKGILPEDVRLRSTKTPIRGHGQELIKRLHDQAEELIRDSRELWYYVDRKKYESQAAILKNDKIPYTHKGSTWFHISRTVSLAIWFDWLNRQKK